MEEFHWTKKWEKKNADFHKRARGGDRMGGCIWRRIGGGSGHAGVHGPTLFVAAQASPSPALLRPAAAHMGRPSLLRLKPPPFSALAAPCCRWNFDLSKGPIHVSWFNGAETNVVRSGTWVLGAWCWAAGAAGARTRAAWVARLA